MQPTLAGFLLFIRNVMGITTAVLPDDSPVIGFVFSVALAIVNPALAQACVPQTDLTGAQLNSGGYTIFALAVYNLAGDRLINYAPDVTDAPNVSGGDLPYFAWARKQFNINGFVSGVIQSSNDESTGQSLVVQKAAENFTLGDLQNLKTPWGRTYLAFAQDYGPNVWGLS